MAMPTSGAISLSQARTELGETGSVILSQASISLGATGSPYSMSELYNLSNDYITVLGNYHVLPSAYIITIDVDSNVAWTASTLDWWLTIPVSTGIGPGSFDLGITKNFSALVRTGEVQVNGGSAPTVSIAIIQAAGEGPINPCFHPDTPIIMADNTEKRLGDIELGEMVMSYKLPGLKDDESNVDNWSMSDAGFEDSYYVPSKVVNLIVGSYKNHYVINGIMKVTLEHHLFVRRDEIWSFRKVIDIKVGDFFWDGEQTILIDLIEFYNEPMPMVTMDVEETDVYFAHGVLVHNPLDDLIKA